MRVCTLSWVKISLIVVGIFSQKYLILRGKEKRISLTCKFLGKVNGREGEERTRWRRKKSLKYCQGNDFSDGT
jgi:hypothetical protein